MMSVSVIICTIEDLAKDIQRIKKRFKPAKPFAKHPEYSTNYFAKYTNTMQRT